MTANESPMKAGGALSIPPSLPVRSISASKSVFWVLSSWQGTARTERVPSRVRAQTWCTHAP